MQKYFIFTTDDGMNCSFVFTSLDQYSFFITFGPMCELLFDIVSMQLCIFFIIVQYWKRRWYFDFTQSNQRNFFDRKFRFFLTLLRKFSPNFHSVFIECNEAIVIAVNVLGIPRLCLIFKQCPLPHIQYPLHWIEKLMTNDQSVCAFRFVPMCKAVVVVVEYAKLFSRVYCQLTIYGHFFFILHTYTNFECALSRRIARIVNRNNAGWNRMSKIAMKKIFVCQSIASLWIIMLTEAVSCNGSSNIQFCEIDSRANK